MLETISERQQQLMSLLLTNRSGLTVEELSNALEISRNAVRQHLTALERDNLVQRGPTQPSGGRPEQIYVLSDKGAELFPRRYSWFSELLIAALEEEIGHAAVAEKLERIGRNIGQGLAETGPRRPSLKDKTRALATVMKDLGYEARLSESSDSVIVASNCVFHHLAVKFPEVCHFDLGLMSDFTGASVEHQECMVRGGQTCRFRIKSGRKTITPFVEGKKK